MEYKIKKNANVPQLLLGISIVAISLPGFRKLYGLIGAFLGLLLIKDGFLNSSLLYIIDENSIIVKNEKQIKKEMKWEEVEFFTISKANKKWYILGNGKETIKLAGNIDNQEGLVKEIRGYISKRKKVYVHERILNL